MLGLGILLGISLSYGQSVEEQVKVSGIRSGKGNIQLSIFKDGEGLEESHPIKNFIFDKKAVVEGNLLLNFKIESGTYEIILLVEKQAKIGLHHLSIKGETNILLFNLN